MKCPFRIRSTKQDRGNIEETTQMFDECYGEECPAAYIVEYNGVPKVEGCKRLKKGEIE